MRLTRAELGATLWWSSCAVLRGCLRAGIFTAGCAFYTATAELTNEVYRRVRHMCLHGCHVQLCAHMSLLPPQVSQSARAVLFCLLSC